jgi:hypothetical protein
MTTREIAEAVGRKDRAVQNWIKIMGAKNASINAKNASSTSTYPADYDLEETCAIIETGMVNNSYFLFIFIAIFATYQLFSLVT